MAYCFNTDMSVTGHEHLEKKVDDGRHIFVNGRKMEAGYQVKAGDVIEVSRGDQKLKFEIKEASGGITDADALDMFTDFQP